MLQGGEAIQLLWLLCLKNTLVEKDAGDVFSEMKALQYIGWILKSDKWRDFQFAECQAFYPLYKCLGQAGVEQEGWKR